MSTKILLLSLVLLVSFVFSSEQMKQQPWTGLGDRLQHTFFAKNPIPLNMSQAIQSSKWHQSIENGACIPNLGYGFINDRVVVYYTKAGQLSGFGVRLHGTTHELYWRQVDEKVYQVEIATRDPSFACSGSFDHQGGVIGDRLIFAPNSNLPKEIPLTETQAEKSKFTKGGCINGMGRHWGFDFSHRPNLSGSSLTLLPVVPMYSEGQVSAVLFFTHNFQKCWPLGQWEGPFVPTLFCKNFCSETCMENESSLSIFSTMHFLFHDSKLNKCEQRC